MRAPHIWRLRSHKTDLDKFHCNKDDFESDYRQDTAIARVKTSLHLEYHHGWMKVPLKAISLKVFYNGHICTYTHSLRWEVQTS